MFICCNIVIRPRKKKFFPVTVGKKTRVCRPVKKKLGLFFWSKMGVLCMFYINWDLGFNQNYKSNKTML